MDETNSKSIDEFCSITGATRDQATFFLESSNWSLDTAVSYFFENHNDQDERIQNDQSQAVAIDGDDNEVEDGEEVQRNFGQVGNVGLGQEYPSFGSNPFSRPTRDKKTSSKPSNNRIKTFSDLSKKDESDDDEDGPNEYYTGGEKSGMMVQDPNRPGRSNTNIDSIFDRARMHGAREGTSDDLESTPSNRRRGSAFSGTARTLAGPSTENPEPVAEVRDPAQPIRHTITFWRNGFTVGDGPLRQMTDPANAEFLSSINKGECPRELLPPSRVTPIEVNLVKKDEDWKAPPKPKYVAFSGSGMTLGGSSSETEPSPQVNPPATALAPSQSSVIDDTKPTTSVQIRLADGTRLVAKFNHENTVADIRRFIEFSRPGQNLNYELQIMGFPPKKLTNLSQSIADAGLLNSVIIQK